MELLTYRLAGSKNGDPLFPGGFFAESDGNDIKIIVWFAHGCAPPLRLLRFFGMAGQGRFSSRFLRDPAGQGFLRRLMAVARLRVSRRAYRALGMRTKVMEMTTVGFRKLSRNGIAGVAPSLRKDRSR